MASHPKELWRPIFILNGHSAHVEEAKAHIARISGEFDMQAEVVIAKRGEHTPAAHLTSPLRPHKNPAFVRFSASSIKPTVPSRPAVPVRQRVAPPGAICVGWFWGLANGE